MSLLQFVNRPDVREILNTLVAKAPRPPRRPAVVPPGGTDRSRSGRIGTAYDYMLRFELGRRSPSALEQPWVAWAALNSVPRELVTDEGSTFPWESVSRVVRDAEAVVRAFRRLATPAPSDTRAAASAALTLARIDPFYRAGFDPAWLADALAEPRSDEVDELLRLLDATPLDALTPRRRLLLNPTFGRHSRAVNGADADLVVDDLLLDVKTGRECIVELGQLRQLVGYLLLARAMRQDDRRFPPIRRLGFLLPRFGLLWIFDARPLTEAPLFEATERWWLRELRAARFPIEELAGTPVRKQLASAATVPPEPATDFMSLLPAEETEQILLARAIASASARGATATWPRPHNDWGSDRTRIRRKVRAVLAATESDAPVMLAVPGLQARVEIARPRAGVLVIDVPCWNLDGGSLFKLSEAARAIGARRVRIDRTEGHPDGGRVWRFVGAATPDDCADLLLALAEWVGARPRRRPAQRKRRPGATVPRVRAGGR